MGRQKVYLTDIPLGTALDRLWSMLKEHQLAGILQIEEIPLDENACGRVLAEPVLAKLSSPHYHACGMDGFAIRAEKTADARPNNPVTLQCPDEACYVDTGDPLPVWANAVVPIEQVESILKSGEIASDLRKPSAIRLRSAIVPWSHVRLMGEDIVTTELVLPAGQVLRPIDLAALAASGCQFIRVTRKPRVAILPTGDELIPIGEPVEAGNIIEFNSIMLAGQINEWGGIAKRYAPIPDCFDHICSILQIAVNSCDLVLINAGSSAGSEDYTAEAVQQLGKLLVHGVAIRPGHPVVLGFVRRSDNAMHEPGRVVPVIGIPGYPVSAAICSELFVEPILARWTGRLPRIAEQIEAQLSRKITSPAGDDDFVRVVIGKVGRKTLAVPLQRGAGVITSLTRADGIVVVPRGVQGLSAGDTVTVRLLRSPREITDKLLAIGSHDMTLDILAQHLAKRNRRLSSVNVGSIGGLMALQRQEAHLAGIHLFDTDTGTYNLSYVKEYLGDQQVAICGWVKRLQGLMVPKGNPKDIRGIEDLTRKDVQFVNRQKGSGTRILFDDYLKKRAIRSDDIQGYQYEEYTHLAVAAAVASGRADCGLGIAAAAHALNLDFIPFEYEQYDLVIPCEFLTSQLFAPLLDLMHDSQFRQDIGCLPGYDVSPMGEFRLGC